LESTKSKKYVLGYTIFTTSELGENVYIAPDLTIVGSFVRFKPLVEITSKSRVKMEGTQMTLPERVIRKIIYQEKEITYQEKNETPLQSKK